MISDALYRLADRISGDVLQGHTPSPRELAAIAQQLMDYASVARFLESLPFEVLPTLVEPLPKMMFVQAVEESKKRAFPSDVGGTQEQWR